MAIWEEGHLNPEPKCGLYAASLSGELKPPEDLCNNEVKPGRKQSNAEFQPLCLEYRWKFV